MGHTSLAHSSRRRVCQLSLVASLEVKASKFVRIVNLRSISTEAEQAINEYRVQLANGKDFGRRKPIPDADLPDPWLVDGED